MKRKLSESSIGGLKFGLCFVILFFSSPVIELSDKLFIGLVLFHHLTNIVEDWIGLDLLRTLVIRN